MVDLEVCYITLSFILPQLIWQYTEPVNMSTFGEGTYASPHLYVLYIDLLDHLGYFLKWTFLQPLFYKSTCKWFEQKRGENSTKVVTHGDLCLCGTLEWSYSCFHQAIHYQLLSLPYSSFSVSHITGNIKKLSSQIILMFNNQATAAHLSNFCLELFRRQQSNHNNNNKKQHL